MFPLVIFTKETCGLFLYYFIKPIFLILESLQGFQVPYSGFFVRGPNFCEICKLRLALQKFSAGREIFLYFQVNKALINKDSPVSQT